MLEELKIKVCKANRELYDNGLSPFTWGNISMIDRDKEIITIKPSGVEYDTLTPSDIVLVDMDGKIIEGDKKPSSDTPTHIELYRGFKKIGSVAHIHSLFTTAFAQAKKPIACIGTTHADEFYGDVPVTRDLNNDEIQTNYEKNTGKVIIETFMNEKIDYLDITAVLVASHAPFIWGITTEDVIHKCIVLEHIAKLNLNTYMLNPSILKVSNTLLDRHYLRKHGKDAYYGQKNK